MNVKVIATCFAGNKETRLNEFTNFPDHPQRSISPDECLERLKKLVDMELTHKEDTPFDVLIVNSEYDYPLGYEYLASINGTKTPLGKIIILNRHNVGWSFGAYSDAFKKYQKKYKYWIFTEDDIVVGSERYYSKAIERFECELNIGFVSFIGISNPEGSIFGVPAHTHGGIGLSHSKVLRKVNDGNLPHHRGEMGKDARAYKDQVIREGEIPFTNEIYKLGYKLVVYGDGKSWDLDRNLCIPAHYYL